MVVSNRKTSFRPESKSFYRATAVVVVIAFASVWFMRL